MTSRGPAPSPHSGKKEKRKRKIKDKKSSLPSMDCQNEKEPWAIPT
jgi:hypothetical protein